jgi:deoxyribodipyrimidine photo-lyase
VQPDIDHFLSELGWREFSHHLLFHFPHTAQENLNPKFREFRWARPVPALLAAWQRGRTGVPIVDAGMRELWHTGWMHNRVRMVVSSFLVKDLLISWQAGAAWFWDTLVDADLANNTLGWQWSGGCGADAAPYFRIFNPITQSQKVDPRAAYIRRWCPELAALDDRHIHAPWTAPPAAAAAAHVTLGTTYPPPIVDHAQARVEALDAYAQVKAPPE